MMPASSSIARTATVLVATAVAASLIGCSSTQTGTPRASDESASRPAVRSSPSGTTSAAPTSKRQAPITLAELKPLLLKRSELAEVMGDTDMQQLQGFDAPTRNDVDITPPGCRNLALPAETAVWSDVTKALVGDANRGAGGQAATQVVALMASPDVAAQKVDEIWTVFWQQSQCQTGQPFTMDLESGQQQWVPDAAKSFGQPQRISVSYTRADPARFCTHAYTSANNVLIEALACGKADTSAQASVILDRIVAKID